MNKHHEELAVQFGLLIDVQNHLKESFNIVESTWRNKNELPCLIQIDQWEQELINRIRQIAAEARADAHEMMANNMSDIHRRLDQLTFDVQQRQEEGNYLDNGINEVKIQLEQLNNTIKHVHEKIRINYSATNKVDWSSLIYVTTDKKLGEKRFNLPEFNSEQEKIWNNFRKLIRTKHTNNDYQNKHSCFKRNASSLYQSIVLTSYGSHSQENSNSFRKHSLSNDDSFTYVTFDSNNHEQLLLQASDA